jgi:DNA-binding transcriptional regulator YiaG
MKRKRSTVKNTRTNAQRVTKLRELMQLHRLTGGEVATMLNVHEVTVSNWRRGWYAMPEASLRYLELHLNQ